ncbi:MAG: iron-sulfur cluster assembly scaffold protein [Alphaproteobacteria bacterium]|nr:iron-sulfur cluster assembly scaffold protein [Alphaproteobacteria bacterium]
MLDQLYSRDVLKKAAAISHTTPLASPEASADRVSPVCGSRIHVEISTEGDRISDYAQTIHACALGQSAAAILGEHVIGKSADELNAAAKSVRAMLVEGAAPPTGEWADYAILAPVHEYSPRHGAVMLALEATLAALAEATGEGLPDRDFLTRSG